LPWKNTLAFYKSYGQSVPNPTKRLIAALFTTPVKMSKFYENICQYYTWKILCTKIFTLIMSKSVDFTQMSS
jgi:hypothetical protein